MIIELLKVIICIFIMDFSYFKSKSGTGKKNLKAH